MYGKGRALKWLLWLKEYHQQNTVQSNTVSNFQFLISNCGLIITCLWPQHPHLLLRIVELCFNVTVNVQML